MVNVYKKKFTLVFDIIIIRSELDRCSFNIEIEKKIVEMKNVKN